MQVLERDNTATIYATITEKAHKNFGHFKIENGCNIHEAMNKLLLSLEDENVIKEVNRYVRENF